MCNNIFYPLKYPILRIFDNQSIHTTFYLLLRRRIVCNYWWHT